jgi:iron(III)-enterobactin esterase
MTSALPLSTPTAAPVTGAVTVEHHRQFASAYLDKTRTVDVYLPPGYAASGETRYPVLYANDGQEMAAWHLKRTLEALYAAGTLPPVIVVGVHASADRTREYGTVEAVNANGMGARAADYVRFFTEELMAFVDGHYRTLTGPGNTAVMGSSLGGLMAFDLAWNRPDLIGTVGVFSGSLWWRTDASSVAARQNSRIAHAAVRAGPLKPGLRFWFEAGTRDETDDRDGNGVIDAIQDTTELIDALVALGYTSDADVVYVQVEGGQHSPATWAQALPTFLTWAFGAPAP